MRARSNDTDPKSDIGVQHSLGGYPSQRPGSRTAAAGSEFLKALGSDLAVLAARLQRSLALASRRPAHAARTAAATPGTTSWSSTGGRLVGRLILGIVVIAVAGMFAVLSALLELPLDKPTSQAAKPTLL